MGDADEIINAVMNDEKLRESRIFRGEVYRDQPILRRASELARPAVPAKIKEMRSFAYTPEAYWKTSAWLFRTQGLFMADYTDDQPCCEDFTAYYPTYRDLSVEQLRGYFTWRTAFRKGSAPEAPQPFIILYMFELINQIGVNSPADGAELFRRLLEAYAGPGTDISRFGHRWLNDYAVYYGLPPELLADTPESSFDSAVLTLINWDSADSESLYKAISRLSAYPIESSAFYAQEPELFRKAVCRVFVRLSEHFETHRKNSLCDKLFGKLVEMKYRMFESAVFFDTEPLRNCEYTFCDIHSYSCRKGIWYCTKLRGNRGRNKPLGELVRTVDSLLRELTGRYHKISVGETSKSTITLAQKELTALLAEEKLKEVIRIDIDLSALEDIRSAAARTCEKLIVDEEAEVMNIPETPAAPTETAADTPNDDTPLNEAESAFLSALIAGGDWKACAKAHSALPAILADSINEKLFDEFGDTVIDFSGDTPLLIEDYADELSNYLRKCDR